MCGLQGIVVVAPAVAVVSQIVVDFMIDIDEIETVNNKVII